MIEQLLKPEVQSFMIEHAQADPAHLLLKYKNIVGVDIKVIVEQLIARRKALKKFPSLATNPGFIFPDSTAVEQSSSLYTANYKCQLVEGQIIADLTGGLGIDSIYFSRHFKKVYYVEIDALRATIAQHNFNVLGLNNIKVVHADAEDFINSTQAMDVVYIDPDRRPGATRVLSLKKSVPDVVMLQELLFGKAHKIIVKSSPMLDITATIQDLKNVKEVHALAVNNECKELLFIQDRNYAENTKHPVAANHENGGWNKLVCRYEEKFDATFGLPSKFLYEPNVAILKSGIQDILSQKYGLEKLHSSTQLFTSDHLIQEFPGRSFQVVDILPVNKKELKKALPEMKANLSTRNFPEHVDKLKRKLQLKDGGNHYLFACRLIDLSYKLILTEKI